MKSAPDFDKGESFGRVPKRRKTKALNPILTVLKPVFFMALTSKRRAKQLKSALTLVFFMLQYSTFVFANGSDVCICE